METEEVAKKVLDTLAGFASSISQTLKEVAPEVWRIMIRQQYAEAASDILTVVICSVAAIFIYKEAKKAWTKSENAPYDSDDGWQILSVVCYCATLILFIMAAFEAISAAKMLINPEYYAIKELMNLAK